MLKYGQEHLQKRVDFMGYIKDEERHQGILFPESIDEYIGEDNAVRVIDEYVEQLNLEELKFARFTYAKTGRPPKKLDKHIKYIEEKTDNYLSELDTEDNLEISDRKPNADEI